jgi:Family of unknown function (DUF5670)
VRHRACMFGMMRAEVAPCRRPRVAGRSAANGKDTAMLWTILLILLVLWVLGLLGSVGGAAVHLLLVLAAIVLIAQLLSGRRAV